MNEKITVLIADDHAILREGLTGLLEEQDDIRIVGSAVNGADAVAKVRELKPQILLLDLIMPEMDGMTALRIIVNESPDTKVIALTGVDNDEMLARAIRTGAAGYLLKDVASSQLINAIRVVAEGKCWLPAETTDRLVRALAGKHETEEKDKLTLLTPRELEVLKLIADTMTNGQIANKLFISEGTVKVHVTHILEKLGLSARQEAVRFAIRCGLVQA